MRTQLHKDIKTIVVNLLESALDDCRVPGNDPCEIPEDLDEHIEQIVATARREMHSLAARTGHQS